MQLDPDKEAYFVLLSDIYQDMNKYEDALDLLRRMSEREQPSSPALVKLAKLEMAFDNHRKATRQINRAIEAEPDNPEAWFIKGYIYEEQNNTEEAIKHYLRAIDKDADFVDPFINLGILYSDRGNDRAIDYFNGALNISPENVNALYLLAMYYQQQEMFEKAESTYQNIISFNPDYPHSYFNIGYIALVHQEDYEKAIAYMDKAIEVQPAFYQAYYNRGYAHELSGKYQQARDDYRKALQIMPNYEKAVEGMNRLDNKIY
jgi:tetratricopeptide (TPR) repeat protein